MGYSPRGHKELDMTERLSTAHTAHKIYRRHLNFQIYIKIRATHSSTLAWKIPWTEEPGRLQSMGSLGVGHD